MSRDQMPRSDDDLLLQRYREANTLDDARPASALRDQVLAQARSVAQARTPAPPLPRPSAANDSVWSWKAFGGLAVLGLVGLLVLQFDRGTTDEREAALGTSISRPPVPSATPPAPVGEAVPATSDAANPNAPMDRTPAPSAAPSLAQRPAPEKAQPPTTTQRDLRPKAPEPPVAAQAPAPMAAPASAAEAETPADLASPAESAAPAAMSKAAPSATPMSASPASPAAASDAAGSGAGAVARESARARNEVSAEARRAHPPPPLHQAAVEGDADGVRRLLAQGVDVNGRDASGRSALMLAAQRGDASIVKSLLDAGGIAQLRDPQGRSAADFAEQAGHPALLPLLR